MPEFVWFFLVEVVALPGENQPLVAGSTASLQCFVPGPTIEAGLAGMDTLLEREAFRRVSVKMSRRYRPDTATEETENEVLLAGIAKSVRFGIAVIGVMVTADETSKWKIETESAEAPS